jgi:hypothetical protein
MMRFTHNVVLNFHPIFIALDQPFEVISDFGFRISDVWYRFALSILWN